MWAACSLNISRVAPQKQDTSSPTDLIIGDNVAKFFADVPDAFKDGVSSLQWIQNDVVSSWNNDWRSDCGHDA